MFVLPLGSHWNWIPPQLWQKSCRDSLMSAMILHVVAAHFER
jgi:hypothetical protein